MKITKHTCSAVHAACAAGACAPAPAASRTCDMNDNQLQQTCLCRASFSASSSCHIMQAAHTSCTGFKTPQTANPIAPAGPSTARARVVWAYAPAPAASAAQTRHLGQSWPLLPGCPSAAQRAAHLHAMQQHRLDVIRCFMLYVAHYPAVWRLLPALSIICPDRGASAVRHCRLYGTGIIP